MRIRPLLLPAAAATAVFSLLGCAPVARCYTSYSCPPPYPAETAPVATPSPAGATAQARQPQPAAVPGQRVLPHPGANATYMMAKPVCQSGEYTVFLTQPVPQGQQAQVLSQQAYRAPVQARAKASFNMPKLPPPAITPLSAPAPVPPAPMGLVAVEPEYAVTPTRAAAPVRLDKYAVIQEQGYFPAPATRVAATIAAPMLASRPEPDYVLPPPGPVMAVTPKREPDYILPPPTPVAPAQVVLRREPDYVLAPSVPKREPDYVLAPTALKREPDYVLPPPGTVLPRSEPDYVLAPARPAAPAREPDYIVVPAQSVPARNDYYQAHAPVHSYHAPLRSNYEPDYILAGLPDNPKNVVPVCGPNECSILTQDAMTSGMELYVPAPAYTVVDAPYAMAPGRTSIRTAAAPTPIVTSADAYVSIPESSYVLSPDYVQPNTNAVHTARRGYATSSRQDNGDAELIAALAEHLGGQTTPASTSIWPEPAYVLPEGAVTTGIITTGTVPANTAYAPAPAAAFRRSAPTTASILEDIDSAVRAAFPGKTTTPMRPTGSISAALGAFMSQPDPTPLPQVELPPNLE